MSDPFVHPHYGPWDPNIRRLAEAHPRLFRGRPPSIWSDLAPGWYQIVDQLCTKIESMLPDEELVELKVRQIKEKFGSLRFTVSGRRSEALAAVRLQIASTLAAADSVCQDCGTKASLRNVWGTPITLCDEHLAVYLAKKVGLR